jgi:hypothetical protein
MYGEQSATNFVAFKNKLQNKMDMLQTTKLLIGLKSVHEELFFLFCLSKIELAREVFLLHMEVGMEVFIPPELS